MKVFSLHLTVFLIAFAPCFAKETKVQLSSAGFEVVVPEHWSYPSDPVQPYSNSRIDCPFVKEGKEKALTVQVTTRSAHALPEEEEFTQQWKKYGPKNVPEPLLHREKSTLAGRNCLQGWFVDPTTGINGVAFGCCVFFSDKDSFCVQLFCSGKNSPFEDTELKTILDSIRLVPAKESKKPNQTPQRTAPSRRG